MIDWLFLIWLILLSIYVMRNKGPKGDTGCEGQAGVQGATGPPGYPYPMTKAEARRALLEAEE